MTDIWDEIEPFTWFRLDLPDGTPLWDVYQKRTKVNLNALDRVELNRLQSQERSERVEQMAKLVNGNLKQFERDDVSIAELLEPPRFLNETSETHNHH